MCRSHHTTVSWNDIQVCSQDPKGSRFVWALNKDHIIPLMAVLERQLRSSRVPLSKVEEILIIPQITEHLKPLVFVLHYLN